MSEAARYGIEPLAVDKETAAFMLRKMSISTLERLSRTEPLLKPVEISGKIVGYPVENLRRWIATRPPSQQLPPVGSGHGRAGKPKLDGE